MGDSQKWNGVDNLATRAGVGWLALGDVAAYVAVSERTLRGWIHRPVDPLPAVQVSGKILIRRAELDAWLDRHRVQPRKPVDLDAIVRNVLQGAARGR
jgi:excisionase family DNA binding protein